MRQGPTRIGRMGLAKDLLRGAKYRSRRKHLPILFIPITRGPIQNFYHFFFGYFVPLYWQRMQDPTQPFAVMSVAPFDQWFDLLPGSPPKIVDQAKAVKHTFLADSRGYAKQYRVVPLLYWDKWERFPERPLKAVWDQLREDFTQRARAEKMDTSAPQIVVLDRSAVPALYREQFGGRYGPNKRSIPNLHELVERLRELGSTELVEASELTPLEMFIRCSSAKVIVGQHGAGLSNVFFLPPGASMVEIVWPELAEDAHINIYGPLCDELGLQWHRPVLQEDPFSPIDVDITVDLVRRAVRQTD